MNMKKVVVCDEDEKIVIHLNHIIKNMFPRQVQVNGYVSPKQLIYEMEDDFLKSADLFFVSLEMKEQDALSLAKYIQQKLPVAKIFFITEYSKRVEEIFDGISPSGVLLKPLREERLKKYIEKELEDRKRDVRHISVKKRGRMLFIPMDELLYVESSGRKLFLHKRDETECVYEKISAFCRMYSEVFVRCHQSYAVNRNYVEEVAKSGILLKGGVCVPVSRQKYSEICEIFAINSING